MAHPEYRNAEVITMEVAAGDADAISRGDAVKLVDDRQVAVTDTQGEDWIGVAQDAPEDDPFGDQQVAVMLKGARNANVASEYDDDGDGTTADVAVSAPAELVPSGVPGELKPLGPDTASSMIDGVLMAAPMDADSDGLVLLR